MDGAEHFLDDTSHFRWSYFVTRYSLMLILLMVVNFHLFQEQLGAEREEWAFELDKDNLKVGSLEGSQVFAAFLGRVGNKEELQAWAGKTYLVSSSIEDSPLAQ